MKRSELCEAYGKDVALYTFKDGSECTGAKSGSELDKVNGVYSRWVHTIVCENATIKVEEKFLLYMYFGRSFCPVKPL